MSETQPPDLHPELVDRPANPVSAGDMPTEDIKPELRRALHKLVSVSFRALLDFKVTPREKEAMKAAARDVVDLLLK